jgi:lysophospholipase L1-like esterase
MRCAVRILSICAMWLASTLPVHADWVASWGTGSVAPGPTGPGYPAVPSFQNRTIRQIVRLSVGGTALRIRFTNVYGRRPLRVGAASLVLLDEQGGEHSEVQRVTFEQSTSTTIPPGAVFLSDPVQLPCRALTKLAINIFLPVATGPATYHPTALETMTISAPGDFTMKPFKAVSTREVSAFLAGIEVDAHAAAKSIVVMGDSISDGYGATTGADRRWPDWFAERLANYGASVWGVVNQGISGNRMLNDGDSAGENALARLDRDALALPGAAVIILLEGVNDLGLSLGTRVGDVSVFKLGPADRVSAAQIIGAYRQLITRAHARGFKVFGGTLTPYSNVEPWYGLLYWSEAGETARQEINRFIRSGGEFDGVIDFDAALRDPRFPLRLRAEFDSGDHLHPNDEGYRAMANAIDLDLLTR